MNIDKNITTKPHHNSLIIIFLGITSLLLFFGSAQVEKYNRKISIIKKYFNTPQDQTVSLKISPYIIGDEPGMLSRYRTTPENITQLSVFPSARRIYLPKDHPRYTELYNRLILPEGADSNFVELIIGEWFEEHGQPVIDVRYLSKEEKERLIQEEKESLIPNEQRERDKAALKVSN